MAYITKKTTVDGIKPIGSNLYGTCSTASGTAAKTVSMPDFNVLVEGVTIHVYFENDNTADNATLKVGSTSAQPIRHNGQAGGSWEAGGFISFTYYNGSWIQNDITIAGVTYTFTINDHTMTISGSDGSTQTITLPDDNTTYTLSKSGSTITLTGSDGSTTSVTDSNTTYSSMTQAQGEAGASTTNMVISPKVLHDVVEALDDDTTYSIGISGHTITLTPSEGTPQSVTVPDNNTTYTISKSGNTVTLTGSDGSTQTFTDSNTTYSAGTGLQLSGTTFSVKTGYTTSGNNRKVQADSNGNLYVVQKDDNTTYTAGDGLQLSGTEFSAKTGYTTSGNNRAVQTDANGNLYVVQKDNNTTYTAGTGLELDGTQFKANLGYTTSGNNRAVLADSNGNLYVTQKDDNTNTFKAFYGTCSTAAATATKDVTLAVTTGWQLVAGTVVGVKFTNTNTAQNPKLNINSTGAKSIYVNNAVLTTSSLWYAGEANRVHYYMYDGSQWVFMGHSYDWNSNTTYTAGTGLELDGTEFNHSNSVTAVTSASFVKVKYDAQGHITGTTAVAKSDITALGIPGSDTNTTYTLSISGHTLTLTPSSGTAQTVTLPDNNTDTLVTQTNTASTNANYRVLMSATADDTTRTETSRKDGDFYYNPSTSLLHLGEVQYRSYGVNIQTGSSAQQHITLQTLMTWLISTKKWIPSNVNCHVWISVPWSYAGNDILRFNAHGTNYECQLAGCQIEFIGNATDYQTGVFRLIIHNSPTDAFTVTSGYTKMPTSSIAEYWCNGSGYSPTWKLYTFGGHTVLKDVPANALFTDTHYTAGTGLDLDNTEFNHSNAVTAVTTEGLRKVKYDAQGHITGSSAVAKADITGLGIPGSDTNNRRGFYGTCTTAAATAAKVVTLGSTAGWELVAGTIVGVKFSYTNTASNPTLNVNSSGAKSIIYNTGTITTSNLDKAGYASRIQYYMYDGSHWVWMNWSIDSDTWQSNTNARNGYVTSGANQFNKVWKTDEDGWPAWRDETKYPIFIATGTNGATTNLSSGVITQIPLTVTGTNLSGNVGSTLVLNSTAHTIAITGEGLYRITASVYIQPTANNMIGAYIKYNTDSASFSGAVEGASSLSYATTTGGAVNITQTIDVPANSTVYVFLCARTFGTTGRAFNSNQATFLEVEQIR